MTRSAGPGHCSSDSDSDSESGAWPKSESAWDGRVVPPAPASLSGLGWAGRRRPAARARLGHLTDWVAGGDPSH